MDHDSSNKRPDTAVKAETKPPLDQVLRSPDRRKRSLQVKVKDRDKTETLDTGQHNSVQEKTSSPDIVNSFHGNAQSLKQSVIENTRDDTKSIAIPTSNIQEKRRRFISWTSSSTSSDSDDSVSIRIGHRERMLPSPLSCSPPVTNCDTGPAGQKDSKYPWRRARNENRDSLHVRSVSEPARNTQPADQIGPGSLPKKSVSVTSLPQAESIKLKPLKSTLEAVKEETQEDKSTANTVKKSIPSPLQSPVKQGKKFFENKTLTSPPPRRKTSSPPPLEPVAAKSNETNTASDRNDMSQSSDKHHLDCTSNNEVKKQEQTCQKDKRKPTKAERTASNAQYVVPKQEDIFFAAADPDLFGLSMPTVKNMVANLNNRLEVIATEHPAIVQTTSPTEFGITFVKKGSDLTNNNNNNMANLEEKIIIVDEFSSDEECSDIGNEAPTKINTEGPSLSTEVDSSSVTPEIPLSSQVHPEGPSLCSPSMSPSLTSPVSYSERSLSPKFGDRKVRFADPPESSVIEIEPSERRRRRVVPERRREDKYPEFYQKQQLPEDVEKEGNESDDKPAVNIDQSSVTVEVPEVPEVTVTPDPVEVSTNKMETAPEEKVMLDDLDNTYVKMNIPELAFKTCSVKELADRLDKIERENELSNLKLRSLRITREEGDKPLVAMDITGRTYSITKMPVTPKTTVTHISETPVITKQKYSMSMEAMPSQVYVTTPSVTVSNLQLLSQPQPVTVAPSSPREPVSVTAKAPPSFYANVPTSVHPRSTPSPSISVPSISQPNVPHVTYKIPSPRRSPVPMEELEYYKQRLLQQEPPPPYSAAHSYEYFKRFPRRNSTGGIMLATSHLGSGRGITFSIGGTPGNTGQINVSFTQQPEDDQSTQVAFKFPQGNPNTGQPSQITLSPRVGSPGLSISYQGTPQPSPRSLSPYQKEGQSPVDESKIIHISYPPNTSPQSSLSSSPRPRIPSPQEYYNLRPPSSPQEYQRPLFVRTDSPLMRSSPTRPGGSTGSSPYLSPPSPRHETPPRLSPHSMNSYATHPAGGATAGLPIDESTDLTQSRSFKNLQNKFTQGGNNPCTEPYPTGPTLSESWDDSGRYSSGVSLRVNQNEG